MVIEVEQLGQAPLPLGVDGEHLAQRLLDQLAGRDRPPLEARVLEAVAQLDRA